MVRHEPYVSASIRRLSNNCISRGFCIRENGSSINVLLDKKIHAAYLQCMRSAVEMAIACGFVVFYRRKIDNIWMPCVPELGTFTWSVEVRDGSSHKRKREYNNGLLVYRIKMLVGNLKPSDLHVVNWMSPMYVAQMYRSVSDTLDTPLKFVLAAHNRVEIATVAAMEREVWNGQKHVIVTEQLDLKDPTPSGIQLLDEMRRYSLTGNHAQEHNQRMLSFNMKKQTTLNTVVDAKFHFINSEFNKTLRDTDIPIQTHILPPNVQATEMQALEKSDTLETLKDSFHNAVYTFFNGSSPLTGGSSKYIGSAAQDHVSRSQQVSVISMCNWLQHACAQMYAVCFDIDKENVEVRMAARSRFEITNVDDVKKLVEANILTPKDCLKLREWYMNESEYNENSHK